jgi:hypothetical protein
MHPNPLRTGSVASNAQGHLRNSQKSGNSDDKGSEIRKF